MLGRLTWAAIPLDNPIEMGAVGLMGIVVLIVLGFIARYNLWVYLWKEWITTIDHKKIGIMYILMALVMLLRGFADAIMMRTQLAFSHGASHGYLPPEHYDQIFSAHGVIMIFFVAMPFVIGFMNVAVPLQIGARDVAFPFLNSISFWLTFVGMALVNLSLAIGEFGQAGWLAYPPLSELKYSPGSGIDYWIWSLQISGIGTLLTGVNFFVTIIKMRAPGMTFMRMPVFVWTILCTSILIMAAFPVLTATIGMLTLDRYLDFHFFTNDGGGNQMMYVNLIWAWGHPEVYILILPVFGVFSEVVSTYSSKRLFAYTSMVWATVSITVLSFVVWLHHFFTMGSGADVNAFFGISTMVIAIPTGVKIFNWLFTMYGGRVRYEPAMLWTVGFMVTFTIGGMTGVMMAVPGIDFIVHNSLFLIAHFHNVIIGGVVFGCFAGLNYWFPKMFGFKLEAKWGTRSFWFWLVGFYVAFVPLYALGFMGATRRMEHYDNPAWVPYMWVALLGAVLIFCGIVCSILQIVVSIRDRAKLQDVTGDIWGGRTLEWAISSPPPFYNFATTPTVADAEPLWDAKQRGTIERQARDHYEDIHMPKNTGAGFIIAVFAGIMGFAMIWYIWWLAILSVVGIILTLIIRTCNDDIDYYVPGEEVARIEKAHFLKVASLETEKQHAD
ncbi:cytochrome o ubiquinol oxidase subunit I [Acidisoma cellulosilytica]|uniref:Cytochrome o ubiquinol oxidase subunit I n=1 Tax=Acidisoma cellulosilyticum TaxID=2802395 RepID=A0A963Z1P7_9PROT|nr:cytochrome o ubiquinol oxidase subunit I [Acidisoma cellulosilyticum]MCB8880250.1 cytochrome o ubiquinol oxidase subunit I [Acidisoma cellulosilyticum]